MAASVCKSYVNDAARRVCGEAIQVHGGIGFTWEYDLHLYFKRAKSLEVQLRRRGIPPRADRQARREFMTSGALAGVTVVDLTSYIAGSYAAMMLADLGADVMKVEAPPGRLLPRAARLLRLEPGQALARGESQDAGRARHRPPPGPGERRRDGQHAARRMPTGWAWATRQLRALNPRLIYCSVTAFGRSGPYRDRPGFDPLLQAMGGVMTAPGLRRAAQVHAHRRDRLLHRRPCLPGHPGRALRPRAHRSGPARGHLAAPGRDCAAVGQRGRLSRPGTRCIARPPPIASTRPSDGEWFFLACRQPVLLAKLCQALGLPSWRTTHASPPGSRAARTAKR